MEIKLSRRCLQTSIGEDIQPCWVSPPADPQGCMSTLHGLSSWAPQVMKVEWIYQIVPSLETQCTTRLGLGWIRTQVQLYCFDLGKIPIKALLVLWGSKATQRAWLILRGLGFPAESFAVAFHMLVTSHVVMSGGSYPGMPWLQAGSSCKLGNTRSCFAASFLLVPKFCLLWERNHSAPLEGALIQVGMKEKETRQGQKKLRNSKRRKKKGIFLRSRYFM